MFHESDSLKKVYDCITFNIGSCRKQFDSLLVISLQLNYAILQQLAAFDEMLTYQAVLALLALPMIARGSNLVEEEQCQSLGYRIPGEENPITALASFPGSGNTWLR